MHDMGQGAAFCLVFNIVRVLLGGVVFTPYVSSLCCCAAIKGLLNPPTRAPNKLISVSISSGSSTGPGSPPPFLSVPKAAAQRGAVNHSKRRRKKTDGRAQNEEFILVLSGTSPNSHPSAYGHSSSKYETRNTDNRTPATGPEGRQSQGVVGWRVNTKGNGAEICGTCLGRKG